MAEEEKKKKQKRPTAKKRDIQNERKRLRNKSFKSKTKTFIRSFKESLKKKESPPKDLLNKIFSLINFWNDCLHDCTWSITLLWNVSLSNPKSIIPFLMVEWKLSSSFFDSMVQLKYEQALKTQDSHFLNNSAVPNQATGM